VPARAGPALAQVKRGATGGPVPAMTASITASGTAPQGTLRRLRAAASGGAQA
jgi:hypothetical protein